MPGNTFGTLIKITSWGDSMGGIVEILAKGIPKGSGAPVFDTLDADLEKPLMGIGAVKYATVDLL